MARIAAIAWDPDHLAMQLFRVGNLGGVEGKEWAGRASQPARESLSVNDDWQVAAKKHGEQW
jgi:hypothetical protein